MTLLADLRSIVGAAHVLTEADQLLGYTTDWTRRFAGPARAVVRPADTAETAAVVARCRTEGIAVQPQGGNTGLVGGSVPPPVPGPGGPPVLLSMVRCSTVDDVDGPSGQVTAGAGVTLGSLQRHVRSAGWEYGVDLAARDAATLGGTIATNAGGIRVCAYGMTRSQVLGVEAVLPDGSVVSHLSGLVKDNTGFDLAGLLTGSEGTLGVLTRARLRLHRPPQGSSVALIGAESWAHAQELLATAVPPGVRLLAAEAIDDAGMRLVAEVDRLRHPLAQHWPLVLLLETEGEANFDLPADADAVAGLDPMERARLWRYREGQSGAYSSLGIVHKLDVSVPLAVLSDFADQVRTLVAEFHSVNRFGVFGHLADGNLHLEILGPEPEEDSVDAAVYELVAHHGGSISAEHGIGRAKASHLALVRSGAELAMMRSIKSALDPGGLFAPGVLLA